MTEQIFKSGMLTESQIFNDNWKTLMTVTHNPVNTPRKGPDSRVILSPQLNCPETASLGQGGPRAAGPRRNQEAQLTIGAALNAFWSQLSSEEGSLSWVTKPQPGRWSLAFFIHPVTWLWAEIWGKCNIRERSYILNVEMAPKKSGCLDWHMQMYTTVNFPAKIPMFFIHMKFWENENLLDDSFVPFPAPPPPAPPTSPQ